ncbi:MAG: hypothetical protein JWN86_2997 [Planctomycetota bacterium]|nr:hypothetical protein [Planctomycetota bacterium]
MGRRSRWPGPKPIIRQHVFPFLERWERNERRFRRAIVGFTLVMIALIIAATATGRNLARRAWSGSRRATLAVIGLPPDRAEIEADWRLRREDGVAQTAAAYRRIYAQTNPEMKRLLDYAGLEPGRAVLRWGNFDKILLLPGTVFQPDDAGRSYRMRPNVRSVWLNRVALPGGLDGFFLVPDRPELRDVVAGTGAAIVAGSSQTTNSWGCRGPEPDVHAPIRGLILGDSNMQGLFVADDETPPERLRHELETRLKTRVSLLNTGHLGYSPEQFYATLAEYNDRFRPHFVLLTLCVNDFGDVGAATNGTLDLSEGKYWIDRITDYCRTRDIPCIVSPMPVDYQVTAPRRERNYPGQIANLSQVSSLLYCFPIEDLADEFLRLRIEADRGGYSLPSNPLYNSHIDDHHFSPRGTEIWGRALGRRLALLLELRHARERSP